MKAPFTLEKSIWDGIIAKDIETIQPYIDNKTIIMINDTRLSGNQVGRYLADISILSSSISFMEVVCAEKGVVQTTYTVNLSLRNSIGIIEENEYRVSSTWVGSFNEVNKTETIRFMAVVKK